MIKKRFLGGKAVEKTNLTIRLPKKIVEELKIEALKNEVSFSRLIVSITLYFIDHEPYDPDKPKPKNNVKVFIHLFENDKRRIKIAAAEKKASISDLFFQAAGYYLHHRGKIDLVFDKDGEREKSKTPKTLKGSKKKTKPFSYYLTEDNDRKLRLLSAETGKSRSKLIMEAVKSINQDSPGERTEGKTKTVRSSINISNKDLHYLNEKAEELNISKTELINLALRNYCPSK